MKSRYPIDKGYFPYNRFAASSSLLFINFARTFMKVPRFFKKAKGLNVEKLSIDGYKEEKFDLYVLSKKDLKDNAPALLFFHGGGFIYEGTTSHYKLAIKYANECDCKVIYVKYNLAPKFPFPYPQEEAYIALDYVLKHAAELGIDPAKLGLTGDSAGATLSVSSLLLARQRGLEVKPLFHLLVYPWLDGKMDSDSMKKFTDTPLWNANLTKKSKHYTNPEGLPFSTEYVSQIESPDLSFMPPCYIEIAEFDCLHDDGLAYKKRLEDAGIEAKLTENKGAMHGYDSKYSYDKVQELWNQRVAYIKEKFATK